MLPMQRLQSLNGGLHVEMQLLVLLVHTHIYSIHLCTSHMERLSFHDPGLYQSKWSQRSLPSPKRALMYKISYKNYIAEYTHGICTWAQVEYINMTANVKALMPVFLYTDNASSSQCTHARLYWNLLSFQPQTHHLCGNNPGNTYPR